MLDTLERERRVARVRIAGEERLIAADHAGLYRDALGVPPPGGLPDAFLADVPDALSKLVARWASAHGPFTTAELRDRYGVDLSSVLRELERTGTLARGELRPSPKSPSDLPPPGASHPQSRTSPNDMPPLGGSSRAVAHFSERHGPSGGTSARPREGDPPRRGAPEGHTAGDREWCDVEVLRRLRRASLAALRKEIEPVGERALTAFMPSWQNVGRWRPGSGRRDGVERLREVLVPLQGLALPVASLGARRAAFPHRLLFARLARQPVRERRDRMGGRRLARSRLRARGALLSRGRPPARACIRRARGAAGGARARAAARAPGGGTVLLYRSARRAGLACAALTHALWDLVWAGEVTNDAFAPLRAPRLTLAAHRAAGPPRVHARGIRGTPRFGGPSLRGGRLGTSAQVQGRWSLTEQIFAARAVGGNSTGGNSTGGDNARGDGPRGDSPRGDSVGGDAHRKNAPHGDLPRGASECAGATTRACAVARSPSCCSIATACSPESRCWRRASPAASRPSIPRSQSSRRSACAAAATSWRASEAPSSPSPARSSGCALHAPIRKARPTLLAAVDPAQPYGATLPWPRRHGQTRRPARVAGAYVVFVNSTPTLYLERGGRGIVTLSSESAPLRVALRALADAVRAGSVDAVALERVDSEPAIGSELEPMLVDLGFRQGPRRLTLRACDLRSTRLTPLGT